MTKQQTNMSTTHIQQLTVLTLVATGISGWKTVTIFRDITTVVPTCEKRPHPPHDTNKIATPPSQKPRSEPVPAKVDMMEEEYATYVHTSLKTIQTSLKSYC